MVYMFKYDSVHGRYKGSVESKDGKLYVDRLDEKWSRKARKALKGEGWREAGNTWTPGIDEDPFGH